MDLITSFYVTLGCSIFTGALGYYLGERGWTGVQNDLNNVKLDIAHIQGKLGASQTTTVVTPVGSGQTSAPVTVIPTARI